MANPRQRRKARSSSHRPVSHSRHAKKNLKKMPPIRAPKVLQDAWDKQKTVRQNYAELGLAVTLDPSAHGGVEKALGVASPEKLPRQTTPSTSTSLPARTDLPSGFGRIIRDQAGNILGYELNEPQIEEAEGGSNDLSENTAVDADLLHKWTGDFSSSAATQGRPVNENLIKNLEQAAAPATGTTTLAIPISGVGSRHASEGEIKYLQPLVKKYGDNVHLMARDLRLNPEQRTAGQLKRALMKSQIVI